MTMAGFTAEASLYPSARHYRRGSMAPVTGAGANRIVQQLKSCGACSPLTWPNGTNTGACAKPAASQDRYERRAAAAGPKPFVVPKPASARAPVVSGNWGWVLTF